MADAMTPERRAEIREHIARTRRKIACVDEWHTDLARDADDLLAEVKRLQGWLGDYEATQARNAELKAEVERLRTELAQMTVARDVFVEFMQEAEGQRDKLRAELEADRAVGHGAKYWHDTYQDAANAYDEFLGVLLDLLPGATDEGMDAYDQIPRAIEKLKAERQRSDELLVGAHNDLCEALGVRHRPLLDVIQHAATVRAERDDALAGKGGLLNDRTFVLAAIDAWQDGDTAPHDVLIAIRDQAATGEEMSDDRIAELRALLAEWKAPGFAHELLAEVERLRAELAEAQRDAHRDRLAANGAIDRIEQLTGERDQAERDVDQMRTERDEACAALDRLRASALSDSEEIGALKGRVAGQSDQIDALTLKLGRAERERDEAQGEREQYRTSLPAEVQDYWAWRKRSEMVEAERDRLAEQVKRATDVRLIRSAIADPGAFVRRKRLDEGVYETVPAWGARAVVLAVQNGGEQRG